MVTQFVFELHFISKRSYVELLLISCEHEKVSNVKVESSRFASDIVGIDVIDKSSSS